MHKKNILRIVLLVFIALSVASGVALAQTSDDYDLSWSTVDGGSAFSSGGVYSIGATIGQPDGGQMSAGVYSLQGGFWGVMQTLDQDFELFLPTIQKP
jgi:uncharacterized membrane protein